MPLRRARSSMERMARVPMTPPVVASSGLLSSERERWIVMVVSSQRDGLWLGCIHEGRGGPDGEHDTRRQARAAAVLARELAVRRLPVPGLGALVIERLVR